jgi:hypothetical protein
MLYTINGSYPALLPFRITLADGRTRTDPATFTPEEIAEAGYVVAPEQPAYDPATHQLGWDGAAWTVDPLPSPPLLPLSGRQIAMALRSIGITEAMVEAEIMAAYPGEENAVARDLALIEWRRAGQYERHHPLIDEMAVAFALPSEQVGDLWRWAAGL